MPDEQISSENDSAKSSIITPAEQTSTASIIDQKQKNNEKNNSNLNIDKEEDDEELPFEIKNSTKKSKSRKNIKKKINPTIELKPPSPQVQLAFDFFTNIKSSDSSLRWAIFMGLLVALRIVCIGLETLDGPNQYTDRDNLSTYPFLLDAEGYYTFRLIYMIPLYFDAFGRIVTILLIKDSDNNAIIFNQLDKDPLDWYLLFGDCAGPLASLLFFANILQVGESQRVLIQLIDLLNCSRIIRLVKDISPIWTFRTALMRSAPHLLVPFFFFMLFNITMAVIFFFIQPCYSDSSCPWKDLFDVSYYAVVTMTTVGYGDQYPAYDDGRMLACFVMIFGALFMSMPLAIIGNEYEEAWSEVQAKDALEEATDITKKIKNQSSISRGLNAISGLLTSCTSKSKTMLHATSKVDPNVHSAIDKEIEMEQLKQFILDDDILNLELVNKSIIYKTENKIRNLIKKVRDQFINKNITKISPKMLVSLCDLNANVIGLINNIIYIINNQEEEKNQKKEARRRLSVLGGNYVEPRISHSDSDMQNKVDNLVAIAAHKFRNIIRDKKESNVTDVTVPKRIALLGGIEESKPTTRSRGGNNLITKLDMQIISFASRFKITPSELKHKKYDKEFILRLNDVKNDPTSLKNKIWLLFEIHHSSKAARWLQIFFIFSILSSIMMLYTQTLTSYAPYGESTKICGKVLESYCSNKDDNALDPGCFVHDFYGEPTSTKLKFDCTNNNCFGYSSNFGAANSNITCNNDLNKDILPFQTQDMLIYTYGSKTFFTSRYFSQQVSDVCDRIECRLDGDPPLLNGNWFWIRGEILINFVFTLEFIVRLWISSSFKSFASDKMNHFDLISIIPFYLELFFASYYSRELDFRVLSCSPEPILTILPNALKVIRMFKLTRHFSASNILFETASKAWKQTLGTLSLMLVLVTLFAIVLFEVESGSACYVGDEGCFVPDSVAAIVHVGDRILIDKNGNISQFSNVFYGMWFTFVTITTTGYGDIIPVTNTGQMMNVFLMLAGICFMAVPLTTMASTFYRIFEKYNKRKADTIEVHLKNKRLAEAIANKSQLDFQLIGNLNACIIQLKNELSNINKLYKELNTDGLKENTNNNEKVKSIYVIKAERIFINIYEIISIHTTDFYRLSLLHQIQKIKFLTDLNESDELEIVKIDASELKVLAVEEDEIMY